jgi:POT family proton-dependent oligopeptide transporter
LIAAWRKLSALNREPSDAGKLAIGCTLIGLANLVFALAAARAQGGHPVGMVWPLIFFGVNALGFLCCWPTLLAVFSRAAPTQVNSTFMGVLYLTLFFANLLVGRLAGFWLTWTHTFFFEMHALLAFAATILTLVVKSYLDRRLGS